MLQYPQEHWYTLAIMGIPAGYIYTFVEKVDYQGEAAIRSQTDWVVRLQGPPEFSTADTNRDVTHVEYTGLDLTLRHSLKAETKRNVFEQIEVDVVEGVARVKQTTSERGARRRTGSPAETTAIEVPVPSDLLSLCLATGVSELLSQKPLGIGEKQSYHIFDVKSFVPVRTELHFVAEETGADLAPAGLLRVFDVTQNVAKRKRKRRTSRVWLSADGIASRLEMNTGIKGVVTRSNKRTALRSAGVKKRVPVHRPGSDGEKTRGKRPRRPRKRR